MKAIIIDNMNHLKRYPHRPNDLLQAWDAADELILKHLKTIDLVNKRVLIVSDSFGALSFALQEYDLTTYTDSFVGDQGIRINSSGKISPIHDLKELSGEYDYVLIKLPKNLSYFEDILANLSAHLNASSKVICGGMIKHLPPRSFDLLHQYIGVTSTSLAEKKARLIFSNFEKARVRSPFPMLVTIEGFELPLIHHSNLFSREKLDIGTRFFLEHIPHGKFQNILDLGCANGIVGIAAKRINPQAKIVFSDESAMAIKSACSNYSQYFLDEASYVWTNCYENQEKATFELVLCNPPFHQQSTVGDFIADQMFLDAYWALKKGGLMRVIGNSHLGYQLKLKKIFGNSVIVATNQKFMIIDSIR